MLLAIGWLFAIFWDNDAMARFFCVALFVLIMLGLLAFTALLIKEMLMIGNEVI
jgi:hypothetical protein